MKIANDKNIPLRWLVAATLLISFCLFDTAVVTWTASWLSGGQLAALAAAFALIAPGVLYTVWYMGRRA